MITKFTSTVLAGIVVAGFAFAQNTVAPVILEEAVAAQPVDPASVPAANAETAASTERAGEASAKAAPVHEVEDYTDQIGSGLKERERRLTLLNEAMMKLREAGELEDAARVEERIRALLAMPPPSQVNSELKAELEKTRARNDELIVQMVAMEEELKRYRGAPGSGSVVSRKR